MISTFTGIFLRKKFHYIFLEIGYSEPNVKVNENLGTDCDVTESKVNVT